MLRGWACSAAQLLWEKMTGRVAISKTSRTVRCPVWLTHTCMPTRSISATTARPKAVSPPSASWQPPPTRLELL